MKRSKPLIKWISLLLSPLTLVALGFILYSNWQSLSQYTWKLDLWSLLGSFLFYGLSVAAATLIWGKMMNFLGAPANWTDHIRAFCVSRAINRLPGPLLQIPGRIFLYKAGTSKKVISFASILELVLGGISAGIAIVITQTSESGGLNLFWIGLAIVLGGILIHPRVLGKIVKLLKISEAKDIHFAQLAEWLVIYLILWFFSGIALFLIIISFHPISIQSLSAVISAWCLSGLVSILLVFFPFGLGLHELTITLLLANLLTPSIAAVLAILSRFLLTLYDLIFAGIAYFFFRPPK